jgi:hypothetical protein
VSSNHSNQWLRLDWVQPVMHDNRLSTMQLDWLPITPFDPNYLSVSKKFFVPN